MAYQRAHKHVIEVMNASSGEKEVAGTISMCSGRNIYDVAFCCLNLQKTASASEMQCSNSRLMCANHVVPKPLVFALQVEASFMVEARLSRESALTRLR